MRNYINNEVDRLMKKYKTSDPFELIDCLGINLVFKNNLNKLKGFYYVYRRERYIVISSEIDEREQLLVAAHELGHDRLHKYLATVEPLKDSILYDMTSKAEYEANLFASELLISDKQIEDCIAEEMDFFFMCRTLGFRPEIVSFKLYNMANKGYNYNLPQNLNSKFLGE